MRLRVLVVDDDVGVRKAVIRQVNALGCEVVSAEDGVDAIGKLSHERFDLILTDLKMPRADGFEVVRAARHSAPETPVVVLTAHGSISDCVTALKAGAANFLTKPFSQVELEQVIKDAQRPGAATHGKPTHRAAERPQVSLLGSSPRLRTVFEVVERVAPTGVTVLLLGETGTGKEVVARLLHGFSDRAGRPFVPVNCGAIPDNLIESELFGHAKGAFTGATEKRQGKFGLADGGTLFLDEIGELAPPLQVKLLRVLQDQVITPIGDENSHPVDVRIIAATHRDLEQKVKVGEFRADLFYRLNVVPIEIPPLRERRDDIPVLVASFLDAANRRFARRVEFQADLIARLQTHDWPGNVRELEHMVERLVVTAGKDSLSADHMPARPGLSSASPAPRGDISIPDEGVDLPHLLADIERQYIAAALEKTEGNKNRAAALLGLNRTTLVEKLKRQS